MHRTVQDYLESLSIWNRASPRENCTFDHANDYTFVQCTVTNRPKDPQAELFYLQGKKTQTTYSVSPLALWFVASPNVVHNQKRERVCTQGRSKIEQDICIGNILDTTVHDLLYLTKFQGEVSER